MILIEMKIGKGPSNHVNNSLLFYQILLLSHWIYFNIEKCFNFLMELHDISSKWWWKHIKISEWLSSKLDKLSEQNGHFCFGEYSLWRKVFLNITLIILQNSLINFTKIFSIEKKIWEINSPIILKKITSLIPSEIFILKKWSIWICGCNYPINQFSKSYRLLDLSIWRFGL